MDSLENVLALAIDPAIPSTIYAAADLWGPGGSSEDIIYKSTDGGQNWRAVRTGISARVSVTSLAIDAGSPTAERPHMLDVLNVSQTPPAERVA
jgi:hypothetical protein